MSTELAIKRILPLILNYVDWTIKQILQTEVFLSQPKLTKNNMKNIQFIKSHADLYLFESI